MKKILLIIFLFLTACNTSPVEIATGAETPSLDIVIPTPIFQDTPTNMTFNEKTLPPDLLRPQPTFSPENAKTILEKEIDDSNCRLPCVIGMTPGETLYESVNDFLGQFPQGTTAELIDIDTDTKTDFSMLNVSILEKETRLVLIWGFSKSENLLNQVYFSAVASHEEGTHPDIQSYASFSDPFFNRILNKYSISEILRTYGKPDFVYIAPEPSDSVFVGDFDLALVYPEKGFFIEYIFPKTENEYYFAGCPTESAFINIVTWPKGSRHINDLEESFYGSGLPFSYFKSLEQTTTLTIDEFFQEYKSSSTPICIKTPKELWGQ